MGSRHRRMPPDQSVIPGRRKESSCISTALSNCGKGKGPAFGQLMACRTAGRSSSRPIRFFFREHPSRETGRLLLMDRKTGLFPEYLIFPDFRSRRLFIAAEKAGFSFSLKWRMKRK